jgi:hypothetical protein
VTWFRYIVLPAQSIDLWALFGYMSVQLHLNIIQIYSKYIFSLDGASSDRSLAYRRGHELPLGTNDGIQQIGYTIPVYYCCSAN